MENQVAGSPMTYKITSLTKQWPRCNFVDERVTLADIPGLVEGAHKGVGLGDKFLRHIERCKVLLHLIDVSEEDLISVYKKIKFELSTYDKNLIKKRELFLISQIYLMKKK